MGVAAKVPLWIVSRSLFGETMSLMGVLKQWPSMLKRRLFGMLILRFFPSRGLFLPIIELEGLKGYTYKTRANLLSRNGGDGAVQAAMVSLLLVFVTMFSIVFFIDMILQYSGENALFEVLASNMENFDTRFTPYWVWLGFYLVSASLIEPFFVGAGFTMYINSRTVTEGWDIELTFKRMSDRIKSVTAPRVGKVLLFLFAGLGLLGTMNSASAETAQERAERVLNGEEFEIDQETRWVNDYSSSSSSPSTSSRPSSGSGSDSSYRSSSSSTGGFFVGLGQILFWGLIVFAVMAIGYVIFKNRHALKSNKLSEAEDEPEIKSVMGMEVTKESLPKSLVETAREAWKNGDHHLALSLLYRGSISWFVFNARVPIVESDTEHDCVRRVSEQNHQSHGYFQNLTQEWVKLAYGKREPSDADMQRLCDSWPFQEKGGVS